MASCTSRSEWVAHSLLRLSRIAFSISFLLGFSAHTWHTGPYALWPLFRIIQGGHMLSPGTLTLFPILAAGSWLTARLLEGPFRRWTRLPWHMVLPVALFGLLAIVRLHPFDAKNRAAITIASVLLWWACGLYAAQEGTHAWLMWTLAAVLALQGGVALAQFLLQRSVGFPHWLEVSVTPATQGVSVIEAAGRRWLRAYGLTLHPNILGGYLAMSLLAYLGCVGEIWSEQRRALWGWPLLGAALGLGLGGLLVSFSRSAWVGGLAGGVLAAILLRPRGDWWQTVRARRQTRLALIMLGATALIVLIVLHDLLMTRLFGFGNPLESASLRERLEDYGLAWGLVQSRPWQGVGPWNYVAALWATVGADKGPGYPGFRTVHNVPLLAAAELGVAGGLLWLTWVLAPIGALLMRVRRASRRCVTMTQALLAGAFLCALIISLLDVYLYLPVVSLVPGAFLGLLQGFWARAWWKQATAMEAQCASTP